jgi:DNA-binding beta-propeller fold protein YncE
MVRRSNRSSCVFAGLEKLEDRQLMSAAAFLPQATSFVYTETDNSNPGQNAVIAYRRSNNGQLTEIGSFKTGGTGLANTAGLLGPDDSDKEVIASPDGKFLFAVNQGSNSVAVFKVRNDGSLRLVKNAAVNSGGTEPVSLSIANGRLYVVNRGDEVQGQSGSIAPTITVFDVKQNGDLNQNFADTTTLPVGLSPSQLLISSNSKLAFLDTFTPPPLNNVTDANEVLPFLVGNDGKLTPVSTGGLGATVSPPLLL